MYTGFGRVVRVSRKSVTFAGGDTDLRATIVNEPINRGRNRDLLFCRCTTDLVADDRNAASASARYVSTAASAASAAGTSRVLS